MRTHYKFFLFSTILWTAVIVGFNFVIDPIQYYRKASSPIFVLNQRYQVPGLIRNYEFDTLFVGTSHSENFLPSLLDEKLGTKTLNLAISGSSAAEQKHVVSLASNSGKLKHVIWEANYRSFSGLNPNLIEGGVFPAYLYRADLSTHAKYLFSIDTLWMSVKNLLRHGPLTLVKLNYWGDEEKHKFDGKHVLAHYCSILEKGGRAPLPIYYEESIRDNLQETIDSSPEVKFHLFLPPFSVYNFLLGNEREAFNIFRAGIYQLAQSRKNVQIHDFMTRYELISNKLNYKDIEHFSPAISGMVIQDVADTFYGNSVFKDVSLINSQFNHFVANETQLPDCKGLALWKAQQQQVLKSIL